MERLLGRASSLLDFMLVTAVSRPNNTPAVVTAPTCVPATRGHSPAYWAKFPGAPGPEELLQGRPARKERGEVCARGGGLRGLVRSTPHLHFLLWPRVIKLERLTWRISCTAAARTDARRPRRKRGRCWERGWARRTCARRLCVLVRWDLAALRQVGALLVRGLGTAQTHWERRVGRDGTPE